MTGLNLKKLKEDAQPLLKDFINSKGIEGELDLTETFKLHKDEIDVNVESNDEWFYVSSGYIGNYYHAVVSIITTTDESQKILDVVITEC